MNGTKTDFRPELIRYVTNFNNNSRSVYRREQGEQGNSSRSMCVECKIVGKRDSRTRIYCIKCKSACCKAHSYSICKNCV